MFMLLALELLMQWLPAALIASAALGSAGGLLAMLLDRPRRPDRAWTGRSRG